MKLAVTYENGQIFGHFGRTENFAIYEISDGKAEFLGILGSGGEGHGALAGVLRENAVNALICGGIGRGAKIALADAGIELYPGVEGSADEAAKAFAEGKLEFNRDTECDHHHGHEHDCSDHGCGHHDCGHNC